ncbi:hypothetical protein HON36_04370 [Candidatus Parcubacteria bacterium]|jgi:hypothetical protein|nr:hypothetical protein [Candidatus Parcubacteria bacterium]MBT7228483.1 hypothetical protein [Candidatus Parcubacteria bacterium]
MTKLQECKKLKADIAILKGSLQGGINKVIASRDLKLLKQLEEDLVIDEMIDFIKDRMDEFYVESRILKHYLHFEKMPQGSPNFDIRLYKHLAPKVERMRKEKIPYFLREKIND